MRMKTGRAAGQGDIPIELIKSGCQKLLEMITTLLNVLISDSDERLLQTKIDRVVAELETWFNRNDLLINVGKTAVILFHNRQTHVLVKPLVTFSNMNLDYRAEIKFLGIQITDTLKCHCHVQLLAGKLCCVR